MNNREKKLEFYLKTGIEPDQTGIEPDDDLGCHFCNGDGWGIVGVDWDSDDYINGPYDGEIQRCPCCGGSGMEQDITFW